MSRIYQYLSVMEAMQVFIPIKRDTIRKNPNAGRTSFALPTSWQITLRLKGEKLPDYILPNSAYGQEYNFLTKQSTWRIIGSMDEDLFKQLKADPRFVDIEMNREFQYIESMRPEPDYLYDYEDPAFYVEGLGEIRVSDLSNDYDNDSSWLIHKETGHAVDVELKYEKINEVLAQIEL